jgi:hypothetical protein
MHDHVMSDLCILALLDSLLHGLQCVSSQLRWYDQLPVNVLDFLHHVRLEFRKGFMQAMDTLQDGGWSFGMRMGGVGAFAAEWFEDGVEELDRSELVVEDVGPRVPPLLR